MKVKFEVELDTDREDDKELLESLVELLENYYGSVTEKENGS